MNPTDKSKSRSVRRYEIKDLEADMSYLMVVAMLIGKQEPRRLKPRDENEVAQVAAAEDSDSKTRAVWNFTVRDTPRDYINVTYWGRADTIFGLYTRAEIGCTIHIMQPRVLLRNAADVGERYRPEVTSPFHLVVSHPIGSVCKMREPIDRLSGLLDLPTKPLFNFVTLAAVQNGIQHQSGRLYDLLVAVRHVSDMRIVNTKNGLKEVRNVVIFDETNSGMVLSFWEQEYINRASMWKPRETILFITDCRVTYDSYTSSAKASPSMKSIITVDPIGKEADTLRTYAKNATLMSSSVLDQMNAIAPELSAIKTVMNIQQIFLKIDAMEHVNSARPEELQFATIAYATIIDFDIDGVRSIFSMRCSLCKNIINSLDRCPNPICLSNTSDQIMEVEKTFDFNIEIGDHTGSLRLCRIMGKSAETILGVTPLLFKSMPDDDKADLKWKYLFQFCELRLLVVLKNRRPFVTVLTCEPAERSQYMHLM